MKRLLLALLITTAARAEFTWRQKAGFACLAGTTVLGLIYRNTVKDGAIAAKDFVHNNPGKAMSGLGLLGVAFLANRDVVYDLRQVVRLAREVQKLIKG